MAEKIRKGAVKAYFKMLKLWSALLLGIVGMFYSKDVWARSGGCPECEYGVGIYRPLEEPIFPYAQNKINQWKGIASCKDYQKDVYRIIKDKFCLEKEWLKLGLNLPAPEVDFKKNVVVEIVKMNSAKELSFKEMFYKEGEGVRKNKVIVFNYYIESAFSSENLAYFFIVTERSDSSVTIQEKRFYDGTYIAKDYIYTPLECVCDSPVVEPPDDSIQLMYGVDY